MDGSKMLATAVIAALAVPGLFSQAGIVGTDSGSCGGLRKGLSIIQRCTVCRASGRRTSLARSAACAGVVRCAAG
jgi:hypothetical protein